MKTSRRKFIAGSLSLTLGGCATFRNNKSEKEEIKSAAVKGGRAPSEFKSLGIKMSSDIGDLKSHYTAIVVGSGYGASVMAARLSSKFKDICVLERGKEWHPGDFPSTPSDLAGKVKTKLDPLGLIDMARGKDIDIICANGLGGTSLINAAIAIRPEPNVFELPVWPEEIREDAKNGELDKYYNRAESILQPTTLNQGRFKKSQVHQVDVQMQKRSWGELSLNIRDDSYGEEKFNDHGYPQSKCVQCGNCCTGCNYGAKNTLLTNYLYMAFKRGVKIFTQVEVESIEKDGAQYVLNLKIIPRIGFSKRRRVTADHVFLGAGSKGSTQILMRSESSKLSFSKTLGTKLSANGDVMGLAYNTNHRTDILARSPDDFKEGKSRPGLIISSFADYRNPSLMNDVQSQFLLLDGVVPSSLIPVVAKAVGAYATLKSQSFYGNLTPEERKVKLDRIRKDKFAVTDFEEGALNHSMLYFACGHDSSGGRFVYNKMFNSFDYVWKDVLKEPTFQRMEGVMKSYAEQNGGTYISNPRSTIFGENVQATHPLGGCPMGTSVATGVVDHLGRVFDGKGGFHDNLYVVDAAIIPHSLSATPLLTITALAERIAEKILST